MKYFSYEKIATKNKIRKSHILFKYSFTPQHLLINQKIDFRCLDIFREARLEAINSATRAHSAAPISREIVAINSATRISIAAEHIRAAAEARTMVTTS